MQINRINYSYCEIFERLLIRVTVRKEGDSIVFMPVVAFIRATRLDPVWEGGKPGLPNLLSTKKCEAEYLMKFQLNLVMLFKKY